MWVGAPEGCNSMAVSGLGCRTVFSLCCFGGGAVSTPPLVPYRIDRTTPIVPIFVLRLA